MEPVDKSTAASLAGNNADDSGIGGGKKSESDGLEALVEENLELRRQKDKLVNLSRVCAIVNSNLELGTLLELSMGVAKEVVEAEAASLLLREEETGDLVFQVTEGVGGEQAEEAYRLPRGEGIPGWVAENGEKAIVADAYADPRFSPQLDEKTGFRSVSILAVPLRVRGKIIGVAQAMNKQEGKDGARQPAEFSEADAELFSLFCDQVAVAIENARLHQTSLEQQRLEMDLRVARDIQRSFLPARFPPVKGYEFAAHNESALRIGGDLYDLFPLPEGRVGMALGDVSGKGVSAALYMARLLSDLRVAALSESCPSEVLGYLNRRLCERNTQGMFVTFYYGTLDPAKNRLEYALAGHHEPILVRPGQNPVVLVHGGGIPLGLDPRGRFDRQALTMERGETVLTYTDGVIEATDVQGRFFGKQELMDVLKTVSDPKENPSNMIKVTVDAVRRHTGLSAVQDDITLLAMKRRG
jgi:sigma-B regulation protein RsbU (phosphoserine phosphatase)